MIGKDIALDEAELLSVLMEGVVYGLSLLMFGGTIWALLSRRTTHNVNYRVLTVACLLLLLSTAHLVIDIIRVMEGFVLYRDTYPGGPIGYFSEVSQWTFVSMNYVFVVQTLLGDGVVLYRYYTAWQSKRIMIVPLLLWCATGVAGFECPYTASQVSQDEVFDGRLSQWITSSWAISLAANLLATALLAGRIWWVDRKTAKVHGPGESQLRPIMLRIILDAGVIYTLTLGAGMVCFLCRSNIQYVILPTITPVISITFYMVIVRVELANRAKQATMRLLSTEMSLSGRRIQVGIMTVTESKFGDDRLSRMGLVESDSSRDEDMPVVMGIAV